MTGLVFHKIRIRASWLCPPHCTMPRDGMKAVLCQLGRESTPEPDHTGPLFSDSQPPELGGITPSCSVYGDLLQQPTDQDSGI